MADRDSSSSRDPRAEYTQRLEARRETVRALRDRESVLSLLRLVVFASGVLLGWLAIARNLLSVGWLAPIVVLFFALVALHARLIRGRSRAERAVDFYERGIARLEDRWSGTGETGERFLDPGHPFAEDLDLFGEGSLFQLLCGARTRAGEATLASWLAGAEVHDRPRRGGPAGSGASPEGGAPSGAGPISRAEPGRRATIGTIRERQEAVAEIRGRLDLREEISVLGQDVREEAESGSLAAWAAAPPVSFHPAARAAATVLAVSAAATLLAWAAGLTGPSPFLAALLAEAGFVTLHRRRVKEVIDRVDRPGREIDLLSEILARFEREAFASSLLARLKAALETRGEPSSRTVARLARLLALLESRRNQIFALPAALLLWGTQMAFAIEAWRRRHGAAVAGWLAAVGEMEALASLAAYAYEHPGDPFPEVADGGALFEAEALGHPLLPEARCVRNDVRLGGSAPHVLVVSGSNMSGKSTLLRSVGVAAVLAMTGAPVRARRLTMSPLAVGASIRIHDSLQQGTSRFYAEIKRLRALVELAGEPVPLVFLLDEILHGTNSHDRRIGAEAIVRGLLERGAVGCITTHDLALAQITDGLGGGAANVHFEDHLEEGRMTFDYRLRPGVVSKSNAIALMRSVGLDV